MFDDCFEGKEQINAAINKSLNDCAGDINKEGPIDLQGREEGVAAAASS